MKTPNTIPAVVRIRTDYGTRHGLLVAQGPKYFQCILPSTDRLTLTRYLKSEASISTPFGTDEITTKRAVRRIRRLAKKNGVTSAAAKFLGIKAKAARRVQA